MNTQPLTVELPRLAPAAVEALRSAATGIAGLRERLNASDLLLAVLAQDGAAARVLDVLAPGRIGEIEEALRAARGAVGPGAASYGEVDLPDGTTVTLDTTAREVLDRLAGWAGRTVDTKAILVAEAQRPRSLVVDAVASLGVGGSPASLAPQIEALARRTGDDAKAGARLLVFRPVGVLAADIPPPDRTTWSGPVDRSGAPPSAAPPGAPGWFSLPPEVSSPGTGAGPTDTAPAIERSPAPTSSPSGAPRVSPSIGPVVDLIARARADETGMAAVYVNPQWVTRVLAAIERSPLTIVVADSEDAVDELAAALGVQLARDASGVFGFRALVALEPGYVATQPANAVRDGLRAGMGGIIYLPNIPRYLDPSRSGGASVDLRRALARGEVRVLASLDERDVNRRWPPEDPPPFELVYLDAAGIAETIGILRSRRDELAHRLSTPALRIEISDAGIDAAARVADRYYRDPAPPAGAIRLLLEAATAIKLRTAEGMEALRDERVAPTPSIDADDVRLALERLTGIKAQLDDQAKLLGIEAFLSERVVGQDQAVGALADAVRQARAGLKDANRPIGSFIFMGPSGVGKTELAKALAEFLFDDADAMVRLDMSEYHERHTIARLIGAPPGYVGYDEGGQLTEPIRRKPYQLVLFDEIEKAHPDVHNVLLQIMDDGRLTDSRGRTVDFRNTVIIMTGNVGSEYFRVEGELGREKVVAAVREEARSVFRPEFLGRVDDFIVFNSLDAAAMRRIVAIQMKQLGRKLESQGLAIEVSPALREHLATIGYAPELGARPLRGEIRVRIERPLSRLIIEGRFAPGDTISADLAADGAVVFSKAPPPASPG
jgi:MoxR-like ATPase